MNTFFEKDEFTQKEQKQVGKIAKKRDRSKYKKTDLEKRKRLQKKEIERKLAKKKVLLRGRVLAISKECISVQYENHIYSCVLRGLLKKEMTHTKNLVSVGDFVLFERDNGSISHVEERFSVLSRQEHHRRRHQQLIASNIDQVLITVSIAQPTLKPHLIDRYIIATYKGNMEPVIVVNKIDLLKEQSDQTALFEHLVKTYEAIGMPVIALSAQSRVGIERLQKQMKGKSSVFAGQSGVGKSSLINAITGLHLPVGTIIPKTQKGMHTTTQTHLIPLSFGGWCIDTPGIRSFGIWDLKKEDLASYFPEIQQKGVECTYPNCTHSHEPGCALKEAVEKNVISSLRFNSYLKLLQEIRANPDFF